MDRLATTSLEYLRRLTNHAIQLVARIRCCHAVPLLASHHSSGRAHTPNRSSHLCTLGSSPMPYYQVHGTFRASSGRSKIHPPYTTLWVLPLLLHQDVRNAHHAYYYMG